ncbi:MAG: hypothetical protein ACOH2O_13430 [Pseudomonas sp.]
MTTYAGHSVEDHQDFLFDQLLPNIVSYAHSSGTPSEVVVMAAFLSLATILQSKGLCRDTLMKAIDAARLPTHEAPRGLQ